MLLLKNKLKAWSTRKLIKNVKQKWCTAEVSKFLISLRLQKAKKRNKQTHTKGTYMYPWNTVLAFSTFNPKFLTSFILCG